MFRFLLVGLISVLMSGVSPARTSNFFHHGPFEVTIPIDGITADNAPALKKELKSSFHTNHKEEKYVAFQDLTDGYARFVVGCPDAWAHFKLQTLQDVLAELKRKTGHEFSLRPDQWDLYGKVTLLSKDKITLNKENAQLLVDLANKVKDWGIQSSSDPWHTGHARITLVFQQKMPFSELKEICERLGLKDLSIQWDLLPYRVDSGARRSQKDEENKR